MSTGKRIYDARFEADGHLSDVRAALAIAALIADRIGEGPAETTPELADALLYAVKGARAAAEELERYIVLLPTAAPPEPATG